MKISLEEFKWRFKQVEESANLKEGQKKLSRLTDRMRKTE